MSLPTHSAPATSLSISRRLSRAAVEFLPPFAVALLILPFIIQYGKLIPWQPSTIDLQVYVYAVKDMLAGKDIFATTTPFWNLYFIYPPIAAILMTPLAFGPYALWQVVWTGGLVWAQQSVLKRCGAPRGWKLGLIGIAVLLAVEPIRTTLGYGQVNTILMALVIADLLPDAPGERRRIPQGTLIGLAAAIKLTPALFVIFAFLIGKTRVAITAMISFAVFTGIGAILLFRETLVFFGGLSGGDTRTASPAVHRKPVAARGVLPTRRLFTRYRLWWDLRSPRSWLCSVAWSRLIGGGMTRRSLRSPSWDLRPAWLPRCRGPTTMSGFCPWLWPYCRPACRAGLDTSAVSGWSGSVCVCHSRSCRTAAAENGSSTSCNS